MSSELASAAASPISPLTVEVTQETNDRLHIKIYDSSNKRWEVPTRYDDDNYGIHKFCIICHNEVVAVMG